MPTNLENSAVTTGLEKVSFHSNPKERQCQKMFQLLQNCTHFTCYNIMLKILPTRLQQYINHELPDVQAGFRKGRGTKDQISNICWIIEKAREFPKKSTSALLTTPNPLTVWITINCGKFLKKWDTRSPDLPPEKSVCRTSSNSCNCTCNNTLFQNRKGIL